jgi:hypothetical protein
MIKNKITNTSNIKLEFFVKVDNSEDKLVSIEPGEVVFSDGEEMTKSMRVFERKNLISIAKSEFDSVSVDTHNGTISATWNKDIEKDLLNFHNIPDVKSEIINVISNDVKTIETAITDSEDPYKDLLAVELLFDDPSALEDAKKQAEEYVDGEPKKEKKKYNYKKKPGRKKKRGPKPGSKRKKEE